MKDENAVYVKISKDIALKIISDEFPEGSILKGRSLLASMYSVSPETIRKAVELLAKEKILYVKHGVGVFVDSKLKAQQYLQTFQSKIELNEKKENISKLMDDIKNKQKELNNVISDFINNYKFQTNEVINFSEIIIDNNSWIIDKTLGEVNFWNYTEATVVAIKRKNGMLLISPGPDIPLNANDKLIFVCKDEFSYERVVTFLEYGIEE